MNYNFLKKEINGGYKYQRADLAVRPFFFITLPFYLSQCGSCESSPPPNGTGGKTRKAALGLAKSDLRLMCVEVGVLIPPLQH